MKLLPQFGDLAARFWPLLATSVMVLALLVSETLRTQLPSLIGILLSAEMSLSATIFVGNIMGGVMLRAIRRARTGTTHTLAVSGALGSVRSARIEDGFNDFELATETWAAQHISLGRQDAAGRWRRFTADRTS